MRSQTTFHAVAECAATGDRPTLCVLYPDRPYVSIGYHQEAGREIDLEYCAAAGIAVLRRQVGGGAVLLDERQLFFHLILPEESVARLGLPLRLGERYARLVAPAVAAYRDLGVATELRPPNDLQVTGSRRKIAGTGAATIGEAFVFVGSVILDFDHGLMARVLRFADERLRESVRQSIEEHVTSFRQETGALPAMDAVRGRLLAGFRDELGLDLEAGALSPDEEEHAGELDRLFQSEAWLHRVAWHEDRPRKLAINSEVRYLEAEHRSGAGTLRVSVRLLGGRIEDVLLSGDFAAACAESAGALRERLVGRPLAGADWGAGDLPGVRAADLAALGRKLAEAA